VAERAPSDHPSLHQPLVYLVDDDAAVREGFALLLAAYGFASVGCDGGAALRERLDPEQVGCILLDMRMPGETGLALLESLKAARVDLPVVIVTGHGELAACRRAFNTGAFDFLTKPVEESVLVDVVQRAVAQHVRRRAQEAPRRDAQARLARLSAREREILDHLVEGRTAKEVARALALSPRTVESHRARIFEKLEAGSLAEAIRVALHSQPAG